MLKSVVMGTLKFAVCDDEPVMAREISELISGYMRSHGITAFSVSSFSGGRSLLESPDSFDVVFLDIQMEHPDGMDTARLLRRRGDSTLLIFVTVLRERVFDAFKVEAYDYLVKPVDCKSFYQTMCRALCSLEHKASKSIVVHGTKMVFITAGMGGGTGTGAAPVIARIAKEMDILTVGIVTIPFIFEGEKKIIQALDGVERIAQHVDALLVINNERLREIYTDLTFMNAFGKADDTLSIAAKSIAEIITIRGTVNLDFADVKTILKDGGVAIMSTGFGEGENRVTKAIDDALHSPLLNNNDIFNAKKVMLNISFCPSSELMMEEMNEIHEFMSKFREGVEVIWGVAIDNSLDTKVKITVLATGFGVEDVPGMDSLHAVRSQEEEERQLQLEEEKEKNKERIRKAYGESASNIGSKSLRKRRHIYLFNTEDLDNDDIIAMVEDSPTYMRDKTTLTKIRTKAALEEETATEEATDNNGVITF